MLITFFLSIFGFIVLLLAIHVLRVCFRKDYKEKETDYNDLSDLPFWDHPFNDN